MQLRELYGLDCPPRWGMPRDLSRKTLGPKLCRVMTELGTPPNPWERYVADVALEISPVTGGFHYRNVGLSVMRQQGKTTIFYGALIHRAMAFKSQNIIYTAQDRNYARQRLVDEIWPAIQDSVYARYWRTRLRSGAESLVYWPGFSRIHISANTESAGHGPPLDMGVMDEIFAHKDDRLQQALSPAMLTREQYGQLWWGSNAGDEKAVFLNEKRSNGRAMVEAFWRGRAPGLRMAHFEWCPPDLYDRNDRASWPKWLPGMCPKPPCRCAPDRTWKHTCTADTVAAELVQMSADPAAFDRAYLNVTRKQVPPVDRNVPRAEWAASEDAESRIVGQLSFGVEVTTARDWASISVAGRRADGRWHLELVARRCGVDWVVPALVRLRRLHDPACIAVDERSPAGALIRPLGDAGIRVPENPERPWRGQLMVLRTSDAVRACGTWVDQVRADQVRHLEQPELTGAVNSAITRPVGDSWMFGRKISGTDITPLMSALNAAYAHGIRVAMVEDSDDYDLAQSVF